MPMNKRFSGKYAAVNGQTTVRNWVANITSTPFAYKASNTRAGTNRDKGTFDWTGSFNQITAVPTLMPGDVFTFTGFIAPDNGIWGTAGKTKTASAIVESVVMTWAWDTNEPINTTVNIAGVSPLIDGTGTITDTTIPVHSIPEGLAIKWGDPGDTGAEILLNANELENVTRATLTLSAQNNRFIDSSTQGWASRERNGIDWTMDIVQNAIALADRPFDTNDVLTLLMPVNPTQYWLFEFAKILNFSGVSMNPNTGEIAQQTINVGMQSHDPVEGIGSITAPGAGAAFWPWTT